MHRAPRVQFPNASLGEPCREQPRVEAGRGKVLFDKPGVNVGDVRTHNRDVEERRQEGYFGVRVPQDRRGPVQRQQFQRGRR